MDIANIVDVMDDANLLILWTLLIFQISWILQILWTLQNFVDVG